MIKKVLLILGISSALWGLVDIYQKLFPSVAKIDVYYNFIPAYSAMPPPTLSLLELFAGTRRALRESKGRLVLPLEALDGIRNALGASSPFASGKEGLKLYDEAAQILEISKPTPEAFYDSVLRLALEKHRNRNWRRYHGEPVTARIL